MWVHAQGVVGLFILGVASIWHMGATAIGLLKSPAMVNPVAAQTLTKNLFTQYKHHQSSSYALRSATMMLVLFMNPALGNCKPGLRAA